jgi:hypothetical protein
MVLGMLSDSLSNLFEARECGEPSPSSGALALTKRVREPKRVFRAFGEG